MLIDINNFTNIGTKLRCHDTFFKTFSYDFDNHALAVSLTESEFSNIKHIVFNHVICYKVTGFEPWGHDSCIFDWQYLTYLQAEDVFKDVLQADLNTLLHNPQNLVYSEFVLASGDRIQIACHSIDVTLGSVLGYEAIDSSENDSF